MMKDKSYSAYILPIHNGKVALLRYGKDGYGLIGGRLDDGEKFKDPYQLPLTGGWDSVKRFQDKLPDGFVRKERRYPNGKYYFREYPFPGIIKLEREHTGR